MATNRSLRPPEQHLSRKSSSSSLYTAAPSEASSGPGGKNFVYADGLLSPPATVPSSVSGNSVRGGVPGDQPDSSVADMSSNGGSESASNIESLNKQAIKALKPQSRTAIGRLSYSLNQLPRLLIVDLHIETETTNGKWEQVKSSRLRGLAAKEWLANPSLANDKHRASLKIGAGQSGSRVDARIAFRLEDEGQRARIRSKIQNMSTKPLTTTKKKLKSSTTKRAVRCRVAEIKDHKDPAAFKESLAHMLRAISQDSDFLKDYLMGKTVGACLPHPDKVGDLSSKFRLYIRTQPSIDPEKRLINFDFDLVPGLPGTDVEDLLSTLFGTHPTADLINRNMDALRYTLCGLQARCIYKPIAKMTNNRANIQLLRAADDSCRKVQIQDVQAHGVPTFKVRTESSEVTIKVADYFSEVRIGGQPLDTALPFVKDNTGAWIPLELLTFEGLQPLLSFGHRNEAIRGEVRRFLKAGGVTMLFELADDLIARCGLLDTSTTANVKPWLDVSKPGSLLRLSSLKPSARQHEIEPIQSHIGLLQIDDPGEGYYGNVLEWGLNLRYQSVTRKSLNSADAITDPAKMRTGEVQLLIAMVNDLGDTTNRVKDVKSIIARLHRAAEINLGLPLICTTYSHLKTRIEKTVTPRDHIPTDMYAKIDYMLGLPRPGQTKPLSDGDTMIVGAHVISQAPNGEKLPYHPTITAVVASKDTAALRYNGSVRIQSATRKETVPVKDPNEPTTYSRTIREGIEHLGDMMRELFKQRNGSKPTRILFFRDSVDFDNNVVRTEIQYICDAYKTEYPDTELLLTYIVVNKNTAITYKTVDEPDTTKVVPEFDYLATGDSHAKHRYYVVCNDMNEIPANLANFTGRLNASFPLNPHGQTSKALPLLHASKLACRVRDYFYYDVPEVKISRAKKPTSDSLELESLEEDRANKDIKEYLGINDPEARQLPWKEQLDGTMFFL